MSRSFPELSRSENFSKSELDYFSQIGSHFTNSPGSINDKLNAFARYVPRQAISTFLARKELFDRIINIHGHIVECGVFRGAGLFTWLNLSSIYEPYNHTRRILGFDTFDGFPGIGEEDHSTTDVSIEYKQPGGLNAETKKSLTESINHYDKNRFINQIPRVELISGDASIQIPEYVKDNKHLVVSLLYLDFDIYKPTRTAIECLWERIPKGGIIAFDELNQSTWPGETMALLDTLGISSLRIERLTYQPQISFAVKA